MKNKDLIDKKESARLDAVNLKRKDTTQKRVAHAIELVKHWTWSSSENTEDTEALLKDTAHAVNLLEAAEQDMTWHCEWFNYDTAICDLINDACFEFGSAMSEIINDKDVDIELTKCSIKEGLVKLSKVLATLIRWDDETADVSEV